MSAALDSSLLDSSYSFQKFATVPTNFRASIAATLMTSPPRIKSTVSGPLLVKCDEPCSITIDVTGNPSPEVTWHVGKRRVRGDSAKYKTTVDEGRHTLSVTKVSEQLEKGVWIHATNELGEDLCVIAVKTYKVLTGLRFTYDEPIIRQTTCGPEVFIQRAATRRSQIRRPVSVCNRSETSVPQAVVDDWKREMVLRNRMHSVDDMQNFEDWKHVDSTQSFHAGDVSKSSTSRSSRRRRRISSRRSRCELVDPSSAGGDTSGADHHLSTQIRSLSATGTTPRFNGNLSKTEDWRPETHTFIPISHADRSSSVDGTASRHRRGDGSAVRYRYHALDTHHATTEEEKTSIRVKSASHISGTGTTDDGPVRRRRRTPESRLDKVDAIDIDVRSKRPPTGRNSHPDRASTSYAVTSKRRSRAAETAAESIDAAKTAATSLEDEEIVLITQMVGQFPESSTSGIIPVQSLTAGGDENLDAQRRSATHNAQPHHTSHNDDALWEMFGVHLSTLVQSFLSDDVASEPSTLCQTINEGDHRSPTVTSSEIQADNAVDSVSMTLEKGTTADLEVNPQTDFLESANVTYTLISRDACLPKDSNATERNTDRREESNIRDIDAEPPARTELEFRCSVRLTTVDSNTSRSPKSRNSNAVSDAVHPHNNVPGRPFLNETLTNPPVTVELNKDKAFADENSLHNDVDAMLSQTVDLQMILCTIDQLIAVSDADVDGSRNRRSKAELRAVDRHHPEHQPASSDARHAINSMLDEVSPSSVVMRRGSVLVHSDDEDDDDDDDDLSEADLDLFYCDATLSATSDLCAQLNVGGDTDKDDDDFDSGEYEKDVDVQDIDVVTTTIYLLN